MGSGPEKKARRTAKALVKLLRRVPAERLEVMLEPDVLLLLWVESGRGKDELEAKLEAKTLPGELLLELIDARGADALWESLSPRIRSRAKAREGRVDPLERIYGESFSRRRTAGVFAGLCALVWSAMWVVGIFPEWGCGLSLGPVVASLLGGALSGALIARQQGLGAPIGFVAGAVNLLSAWLWASFGPAPGRLVAVLAVLPGVLLGLGLLAWLDRDRGEGPKAF